MKKLIFNVSGSRKKAIARATVREGKGNVVINQQNLATIEPLLSRLRLQEPLELAQELASKVDIKVKVHGGGSQSQIEATRLAIAKAIFVFSKQDPQLKKDFLNYDRHLLVADVRRNEPHKPNDSKPRAKRQKSYR
ncbi:30S ribosomal protein S9 [Candidatus Woesearchaeota archaeon]|jgi:small subunit ribosomal protein S9|nr:30S ribosomal protein S9 [Candidatus Woesearchaeota archaeon]MBT3439070.1 30S ribosomal protein S9 [Candidatus Woesearchaeota archaeon]MBT4058611.1 30S ribosomal protein S9 [Candidatus Woesearchaeota archaeon]MBT4207234.1 30S ribosomal protein S9 [Candidatus Woesearchaeota archaeon]MBT4731747.1 30S ribosomal protein S9 [Candidatus Woesearchaeota archaeon]